MNGPREFPKTLLTDNQIFILKIQQIIYYFMSVIILNTYNIIKYLK